jgi:tetratricopeptide (TPR) repeat protein
MTSKEISEKYNKGLEHYKNRDYKKALKEYKDIVKLDPNFSDAVNDIGLCYLHLKKYPLALGYFEKATSLEPENWVPQSNIAMALVGQKRNSKAIPFFQKALKLGGDEDVLFNTAVNFYVLAAKEHLDDNTKQAHRYIDKAIKLYPKDADFFVLRGDLLSDQNEGEAALYSYLKAKELGDRSKALSNKINKLKDK